MKLEAQCPKCGRDSRSGGIGSGLACVCGMPLSDEELTLKEIALIVGGVLAAAAILVIVGVVFG